MQNYSLVQIHWASIAFKYAVGIEIRGEAQSGERQSAESGEEQGEARAAFPAVTGTPTPWSAEAGGIESCLCMAHCADRKRIRWIAAPALAAAIGACLVLLIVAELRADSPAASNSTRPVAAPAGVALDLHDSYGDGTPDGMRLAAESDRQSFRRWFAFLAETRYFAPEAAAAEVIDCAALLRFSYREALRRHDARWAADRGIPVVPELGNVAQYEYPHTALGVALFRVRPGPFLPRDLRSGAFAEFADANTLRRYNAFFVARELRMARRGDLLFFYQPGQDSPYHAMIYLGRSQLEQRPENFVVYHTGPIGKKAGEIRRITVGELMAHPEPRWRPLRENPVFLGVYRWTILRGAN